MRSLRQGAEEVPDIRKLPNDKLADCKVSEKGKEKNFQSIRGKTDEFSGEEGF